MATRTRVIHDPDNLRPDESVETIDLRNPTAETRSQLDAALRRAADDNEWSTRTAETVAAMERVAATVHKDAKAAPYTRVWFAREILRAHRFAALLIARGDNAHDAAVAAAQFQALVTEAAMRGLLKRRQRAHASTGGKTGAQNKRDRRVDDESEFRDFQAEHPLLTKPQAARLYLETHREDDLRGAFLACTDAEQETRIESFLHRLRRAHPKKTSPANKKRPRTK